MTNLIKTAQNSLRYWYLPLIVGILFTAAGVFAFTDPEPAYLGLAAFFAIAFIITGIIDIAFSISNQDTMENWGWALFFGIAELIIGILLVANPDITVVTMPIYVSFLIMFRSIGGISYSLDLKDAGINDWGWLMFLAILGIVFSLFMLFNLDFAGMSIVIWTGIALLFIGVFSIILSINLKRLKDTPKKVSNKIKKRIEELENDIKEELDNFNHKLSSSKEE